MTSDHLHVDMFELLGSTGMQWWLSCLASGMLMVWFFHKTRSPSVYFASLAFFFTTLFSCGKMSEMALAMDFRTDGEFTYMTYGFRELMKYGSTTLFIAIVCMTTIWVFERRA